jgi:hypothetical protein
MNPSSEWTTRIFSTGLAVGICSSILLTCTGLHYHFVFLPKYYGSFSKMFWQKPAINFEQGLAYLNTTAGMVLVSLSLGGICLAMGMMKISVLISDKNSKQREKEFVEQWLKENPPQMPKQRESKQGKSRKRF